MQHVFPKPNRSFFDARVGAKGKAVSYPYQFVDNVEGLELSAQEFQADPSDGTHGNRFVESEGSGLPPCTPFSLCPNSPLGAYFREIHRFPLLSPEQERSLAKKIQEGRKQVTTLLLQSPVGLEWIDRVANQIESGEIRVTAILEVSANSLGIPEEDDSSLTNRFLCFARDILECCSQDDDLGKSADQIAIGDVFDELRIKMDILDDLHRGLRKRIHLMKRGGGISFAAALRRRMDKILSEVERYQQEVQEARNDFVRANLRLVVTIARNYVNRGLLLPDLIQEGNIGLIKAVDKFDYRKGYKFSTHASWWIVQTISRAIVNRGRLIRVPAHVIEDQMKITRASSELLNQAGREPTASELVEATGMSLEKVNRVFHIFTGEPISLDGPVGGNGVRFEEVIADEKSVSPLEMAIQTGLGLALERFLTSLTPREAKVVRMRFGIGEKRQYTLGEVGQEFGISTERIRQIESRALRKLKDSRRKYELAVFYE
jgi:RNA polymerase primary sigma factor